MHPLAAQRFHVDAWVRYLTTQSQPRTGRPTSAATIARRLSALSRFYDYGIHDAQVLTHSPVASVRRPRVSDDSQAVGLTAEELRRLLAAAAAHSARMHALVALLTFCGLRIGEALGADVRDYGHDHGHRVLRITRRGGKAARVPLPPPVVRALDDFQGVVLRAILRNGPAGSTRVPNPHQARMASLPIGETITARARSAGLQAPEAGGAYFTAHSTRAGFATQAADNGVAERDIVNHGRWKSVAVARGYIRVESTRVVCDHPADGRG